jgi:hypothetical protein
MTLKHSSKIKLTFPTASNLSDAELKELHFRKKYGEGLPTLRSSGRTNTRFITYGRGKRFSGVKYVCYGCDILFVSEGWAYRTKKEVVYICPKCKLLIINLADVDVLNISSQGGKVSRK